jgi:hypothetical protein
MLAFLSSILIIGCGEERFCVLTSKAADIENGSEFTGFAQKVLQLLGLQPQVRLRIFEHGTRRVVLEEFD